MAWNEPGKDRNPWDRNRGSQGPPDLDEVVRNLQRRLGGILGGRGGGGTATGGRGPFGFGLSAILLVVVAVWLLTGLYKIDDAERGVVLRFGAVSAISPPGLRWRLPWPIESVEKVNIAQIRRFDHQALMLTEDENIVDIELVVQYQAAQPKDWLFNVRDPETTVNQVGESAIREVVGKSGMDFVLGEGRAEIADRTMTLLQDTLDSYEIGVVVTSVNLQDAQPPEQVQAAVEDAIKAREDKDRLRLEAQAYSNDILPKARGRAAAMMQEAEAYRARVVADSQGEAGRFSKLLTEYELAPEVTRERLYIQTIEDVIGGSSKVILDAEGSGNLLYLPIDKLLEQRLPRGGGTALRGTMDERPDTPDGQAERRSREDRRQRGSR